MKFRLIKFGVPLAFGLAVLVYGMLYRIQNPTPPPPSQPEVVAIEETAVQPPVSVRELLHNLSEHRGPIRSGSFKGYTNLQSADPLKLKLNWDSADLRLEWQSRAGSSNIWSSQELGLFQFKQDPQSLVIRLPDKSFLYMKYEAEKILTAYPQSLKVFTGWHVRDRRASKVVMIEDLQSGWPRAESLKEIWPEDLPY